MIRKTGLIFKIFVIFIKLKIGQLVLPFLHLCKLNLIFLKFYWIQLLNCLHFQLQLFSFNKHLFMINLTKECFFQQSYLNY